LDSVIVTLEQRQKHIRTVVYVVIVAATLVAYEPIRHNGFVNYDDDKYITENPVIKSGITRQSAIEVFKPHYFMWHPLTTFTNMLDCQLFGLNPLGHHLVSLTLHIVNSLLLFWILVNLTGTMWASAFVAAVFALHPLQVESVAWASERKTVLSGLFWFLTIAAYVHYTKQPRLRRYLLVLLIFGLCIMTKPTVVTLPLVLLLLDYWPLGRFGKHPQAHLLIEKIPLLVLSAALSAITFIVQQEGGAVKTLERMPLDFRVANTFIAYIRYIGKLIAPCRLAVFYPLPYTNFPIDTAVVCAILFILITAVSIYFGLRRRYVIMGWLWYVGTLVPVIGLVQSGDQAIADRYMYLPMLGLLFIGVWTVKELFSRRFFEKVIITALATAALVSAVIITRTQVSYWQNSKTLFEHTLKVTENNTIAENSMGCILYNEGNYSEAEKHLRNSVKICPPYFDAQSNLGKVLLAQGKLDEAIGCFTKLLPANKTIEDLHYNLAMALSRQKKYDEAIRHLAAVIEINPRYLDAREKMGALMLVTGRIDESIRYLNEAMETSTDKVNIYAGLGMAYIRAGKKDLAIENLTKAVELKSDDGIILNGLSWLLATRGEVNAADANKAIEYARRACEKTEYKNAAFIDTLAAAYAAGGKFEEAVITAQKAIDAARATGQVALVEKIQERLKLYKSGQRYYKKE
jgi:tetratricopeptide (TPR) repeat protein